MEIGPGYWKFNNSLLEDKNYVTEIKDKISQWKNEIEFTDSKLLWEYLKYKIRTFTISFSKNKAVKFKDRVKQLYCKILLLINFKKSIKI